MTALLFTAVDSSLEIEIRKVATMGMYRKDCRGAWWVYNKQCKLLLVNDNITINVIENKYAINTTLMSASWIILITNRISFHVSSYIDYILLNAVWPAIFWASVPEI